MCNIYKSNILNNLMKTGFNINMIKGDGYLVIPVSIARIEKGQEPKKIYEICDYFAKKLETLSNDVIILYTNGLYLNNEDITYKKRVKMNEQVLKHSNSLRKMFHSKKQYIPSAIHYLPIDYVILNSKEFHSFFQTLKQLEKTDKKFKEAIKSDIGKREYNEANVNFILEEVCVTHIIRQKMVEFPRTLVKNDIWRLIVYSGPYMKSDVYQWKNKILPQKENINPYAGAQYDYDKKKIFVFDEMK